MSFDPQDCEEMPILASEHIEKLEEELIMIDYMVCTKRILDFGGGVI